MNKKTERRSRWYWALALIPLLGCVAAMVLVYRWFPGLPGTLQERVNIDNLTQVVVPGSGEISFSRRGAYAVYYEHRSVVDGVAYRGSESPPTFDCSLKSKRTGREIEPADDYVPTNSYSTKDRDRVGVLIASLTIDEPGTYQFSCRYKGGGTEPPVVLAVGPNFVWEFFSVGTRAVLSVAAGLAALLGFGVVAATVALVVSSRRQRAQVTLAGP